MLKNFSIPVFISPIIDEKQQKTNTKLKIVFILKFIFSIVLIFHNFNILIFEHVLTCQCRIYAFYCPRGCLLVKNSKNTEKLFE